MKEQLGNLAKALGHGLGSYFDHLLLPLKPLTSPILFDTAPL